jgi:methionyl-tRNA formyltransferase
VIRRIRVVFLGNDRWSVPALEALAASGHPVAGVVTAAPKPAGRGNEPTPTAVGEAARGLGLPVAEVETVRSGPGFEALAATTPDVLAVVAYGELLPLAVLELARIAPVNLHFSLLPELRGASPVQTALLRGSERTGVTTIVMDEGLDTGPVLQQREEPIRLDDDAGTLGARLAILGAEVLVGSIDALASGSAEPIPQDEARATFAPRLRPQDRELDWSAPARALVDRIRALSPEPAATTSFRGDPLKLFRAETVEGGGEPGVVVEVAKDGLVVGTGHGGLRPLDLVAAGRRRMRGRDFVNGYRPRVGERLG